MFRILKKYYKKMAKRLLTPIWHVIPLRYNNPTRMVLNKQVFIKGYGTGPYNRILAVVYVGKKNVNLELIKAGYAEVYQGKPPRGFDLSPYLTAEAQAKSQRRGMWSQGDYISPKEWRKLHK